MLLLTYVDSCLSFIRKFFIVMVYGSECTNILKLLISLRKSFSRLNVLIDILTNICSNINLY